jgi:hypothetical protein
MTTLPKHFGKRPPEPRGVDIDIDNDHDDDDDNDNGFFIYRLVLLSDPSRVTELENDPL